MPRTVEQIQFTPHMPKALRVAAYARVSCGKDAMLHSLAAQVDHYSTYIRHHPGWEYVGAFMQTKPRPAPETAGRTFNGCSPTVVWGRSITSLPSPYPAFPGTP